ncbi:MAG: acetylxylan esterase [Anaerolineae bacterium]|nr:acetylxylan esterase [Anaerolineae bacterium]
MTDMVTRLSAPPYTDLGPDQGLEPLFGPEETPSLALWERRRRDLRARWEAVLGSHSYPPFDTTPETIDRFDLPRCRATLYRQPNSPETRQQVLIMEPESAGPSPLPGAVVPFYDPDRMAGYDLKTRQPLPDRRTTQFGRHLVEHGFIVACVEAFPYNTVPDPRSDASFAWWHAGAAKVLGENPNWTGMGKLVHDTRLATDLLLAQPKVDPERVLIIGHSLGGKMATYNGCLDERIKATIASDLGIGYSFTNWQDPWYLGRKLAQGMGGLAHHHLLALHAPRPYLLIAGQYDGPASWQYLNAARAAYAVYGKDRNIGCFDHGTGHQPTEEAMVAAYQWLCQQFGLPTEPWTI